MLLDLLKLGGGDDTFQIMEAFFHLCEAEPRRLLLLPDSLELPAAHLFSNTGALLPLLNPLRKDLVDPTAGQKVTTE